MSMSFFNLLFSRFELQTLPKMDRKFIINEPYSEQLISFLLIFRRFFLKISEIFLQKCLLEDHFLQKNTKVYLLQNSDADFLCFISSSSKVLCKNFSKLTGISGGIKTQHWPKMSQNIALIEVYLGPSQTSMVKVFHKNTLSQMLDRVLNTHLRYLS